MLKNNHTSTLKLYWSTGTFSIEPGDTLTKDQSKFSDAAEIWQVAKYPNGELTQIDDPIEGETSPDTIDEAPSTVTPSIDTVPIATAEVTPDIAISDDTTTTETPVTPDTTTEEDTKGKYPINKNKKL